jgi:SAM-dependent methyltransferase
MIITGYRGLDVGSANNAFVDAARHANYDCYGIELNPMLGNASTTYSQPIERCNFPEGYFDFVTFHDVLEHMVDPGSVIERITHCLKDQGLLVIDWPDYFDPAGRHHWRPIQHLWYPTNDQLINFVEYHGFEMFYETNPIPGKRVFHFRHRKRAGTSARFLMLPGMGDIYWVMIKMQDFMKQHRIQKATVDIWDFDDRPRSIEYVERIPFVTQGDYFKNKDYRDDVFRESYHDGPRSIFPGYKGYDYYFAVNGVLRVGHALDDASLDIGRYQSDWYFPYFMSVQETAMGQEFRRQHGPFIMTHFSSLGMFRHWQKCLTPDQAFMILREINMRCGKKIVLTGKYWDSEYNQALKSLDNKGILIDLVDQTPMPMFLSMMAASDGMFGWCGGNTVKSTYFRRPTVMLWHNYFPDERFFVNSCPPDSLGNWYWPLNISRCTTTDILNTALKAFGSSV